MENRENILNYYTLKTLNNRNSVFLVEDINDGKRYIKKYIDENSVKIYNQMFSIRHKNIPVIHHIFRENGIPTVIEEYIEGESIADIIEKKNTFTISEVVNIICQLCNGIKYIHNAGIIHRDMTPNNIIIDKNGTAKIIDMGISRMKNKEKTVDTTFMGTEGFAAPEQFGFRQTDERSDIFAIGVLINVMLTSELPSVKKYKGNIVLEKIISKCIEIDPSKRYKNIDELKKIIKSTVTEKDSVIKAFFKELPGFRSRKIYKMFIALLYYILLLYIVGIIIFAFNYNKNVVYLVQGILFIISNIIIPWLILTNYKYYIDRLKFTKKLPDRLKGIACFVLGILYQIITFYIFYITIIVTA